MAENREVELTGCAWLFGLVGLIILWSMSEALWSIAKTLKAMAA